MKSVSRALFIVLAWSAFSWAQTNNILYGGDFDAWDGDHPFGWTQRTSGFDISQTNSPAVSGNAVQVILRSTTNQDLDHDTIAVIPGANYTFSVWAYDTSYAKVRLAVLWYDSSGGVQYDYSNVYSSNQDGWQQLVYETTAPSNAVAALPRLRFYDESGFSDSAILWIDEAEFVGPDNRIPVILRAQIGGESSYRPFWVDGSWDNDGNYDFWWRGDWVELRDDGVWPDETAGDHIFSGVTYFNPNLTTSYYWWVGSEPFWSPSGSAWLEDGTPFSIEGYTSDTIVLDPVVVDPSNSGFNDWVIVLAGEQNGWNNADDNLTRNGWVWGGYFNLDTTVVGDTFEFKFAVMHSWEAAYGDGGIGGSYPNYKYPVTEPGTYYIAFDDSTNSVIFERVEQVPLLVNEFIVTPTSAEAIEVYNPNDSDIDMSNYFFTITGSTFEDTIMVASGVSIPANGYLAFSDNNNNLNGDLSLPNEGAVITLYNADGQIQDMVGYGTMGPAPAPIYQWSTARVNNTGDNAVDFNMDPTPTMGAENDAPNTALGNTTVYLNEVGPGDYKAQFFELYNAGSTPVDISNWMVVVDDDYYVPNGTVLEPGQVFTVYENDFPPYFHMDASKDNIYLFNADGERVDQMGWDQDPGSQTYSVIPDGDRTTFDGYDNETSVDFELANPTPGQLNYQPVNPVTVILSAQVGGDSHYRSFWVNGSWDSTGHFDPMWSGPMVELRNDGVWPDTSADDDIFTGYVMLYPDTGYYWWWVGSENDFNSFLESGTGIMVDATVDTVYAQTCFVDPSDQGYNDWVINVTGSFNGWDPTIDNTFRVGTKWYGLIDLAAGSVEYKYTVMHSWLAAYGDGGIGNAGQNYSYEAQNAGKYLFIFDDEDNSQRVMPIISIYDIQGQAASSPYEHDTVATIGVVTAVTRRGFFMQEKPAGPWTGIYVYTGSAPSVARGDSLLVIAQVAEYYNLTELKYPEIITLATNVPLPDPLVVSTGEASDEQYESVLLRVENAECVDDNLGYGEWMVNDGSGDLRVDDLMYGFTPQVGTRYNITGPLYYSYGNYKLEPRDENDIEEVRYHDVAVAEIAEPEDSLYELGSTITPTAMLVNHGGYDESVDVTMTVYQVTAKDTAIYTETVNINIAAGDTAYAAFSDYQLNTVGYLRFEFNAPVDGDTNTTDNTMSKQVFVYYHDAHIASIVSPDQMFYSSGDNFVPTVEVTNEGNIATDIPITLVIKYIDLDSMVLNMTNTITLDAGATGTLAFPTYTVGDPGRYCLKFVVGLADDIDTTDNVMKTMFYVPENIAEDTVAIFTPQGMAGVWEFGEPSYGPGSAYSGTFAWGTVLGGDYPNDADARLVSPLVVVTEENAFFAFRTWYDFSDDDAGRLEYSTDDGNTWHPLDIVGGYPGTSPLFGGEGAFVGSSGGWVPVVVDLSAFAGDQPVPLLIAFHFVSNDQGTAAGWYIDEFMRTWISTEVPGDVMALDIAVENADSLFVGNAVTFGATIRNNTFGPTASFRLINKVIDPNGIVIYTQAVDVTDLTPGETRTVYTPSRWIPMYPGTYTLVTIIQKDGDPNISNNTIQRTVVVQSTKGQQSAGSAIPAVTYLAPARPNPFRDNVAIAFGLKNDANVKLFVLDATGRLVRTLHNGAMNAGTHTIRWDGRDNAGNAVKGGIYFVRMVTSDGFAATRRIVLLR